jgi:hypothetical protein
MKKANIAMLALAVLVSTLRPVIAQDSAPIARVQPYLEKTTVAAVNIDVAKLDFPSVIDWIGRISPNTPVDERNMVKTLGGSILTTLRQAGVSNAYASVSLRDVWTGGIVVYLPCQDTASVKALAEVTLKQLPMLTQYQAYTGDGIVVVSRNDVWSRISSKPDASDKSLLASIEANPAHNVVVGISIPQSLRKEVAQLWPQNSPDNLPIKFSPRELMSDIESIRLTANLSLQPTVTVTLNSETAEGAKKGQAFINQLVTIVPDVGLASNIQGQSLKVTIDDKKLSDTLQNYVASNRFNAQNHLRQMGLGIMIYEQTHRMFPPRETRTKDGKPLLSWRVHILPYLEQQALYDQFHLDEPWDSPHNATLVGKMPEIFAVDNDDLKAGKTRMQMPMMEGATFYGDGPQVTFAKVTDGAANTILVVQAPKENAVPWTQPKDLELSADRLKEQFFGNAESTNIMCFDGAVRKLFRTMKPEYIKAYITCAGNDYNQEKEE